MKVVILLFFILLFIPAVFLACILAAASSAGMSGEERIREDLEQEKEVREYLERRAGKTALKKGERQEKPLS